jgi:peptidoglycan/xylan/chitin deacetylase (PgdA/CDA1 family)
MLRLDALATLYVFRPLRRLSAFKDGVPILMYHSVSDSEDRVHPYYRTATSPGVFAEHMKCLRDGGYTALGLDEVARWLQNPTPADIRPVAITFDDGFEDFYLKAFPILERYGFTASMYLPTSFISEESREFTGKACMTWSQVRELHKQGIQFGSHTVTHPQLRFEKLETVRQEIRDSKDTIEQKLGCSVTSFAYPYAFPETDRVFRRNLREMLEDAGYENGVSTIVGTAARAGDRYFMKRLPANSCDDLRLFRAKLEGAYDWVHTVQYASKLLTARA